MIELDYNKNTRKLIIKCIDTNLFNNIREHFSVEDKNAKFIQRRFKSRSVSIPSRKYAITPTGSCDIGLFWEIKKFLINNQVIGTVAISDSLQDTLDVGLTGNLYSDFNINLRDYQIETLTNALKIGRGTCVLGTGAGKTFTTAALIENTFRYYNSKSTFKCLLIVPDLGLVTQTYNEFLNLDLTFSSSIWTGSNALNTTSNVIICNTQILLSQIKNNDWIKYVDMLVIDECHKVKPGNELSKIVSIIKTPHKYGFTGTLPQDNFEKWFIIGKLGPVVFQKSSFDLRRENYLTNVNVKILKLFYNNIQIIDTGNKYRDELQYLYNNDNRNIFISKICQKLINNTLILVNHIEHGEIIESYLNNNITNKQIFFIRGSVDVEERENIKKLMEADNNIICIAISAIFSTGVNIKNLHNIMFVAGGKSFIRTVQSIGRGLRLHETKEKLQIIDISDNLNYSNKHCDHRKLIYMQEKIDFVEKVVNIT
jgi:superfamily II DNA or RNA helicase